MLKFQCWIQYVCRGKTVIIMGETREGGKKRGRERRETGEVIWWKEDLPHHIHTHLSSDRILKEREKRRDQSFPQSSF